MWSRDTPPPGGLQPLALRHLGRAYSLNGLTDDSVLFVAVRFFESLRASVDFLGPEQGLAIYLDRRLLSLRPGRAPRLTVGGQTRSLLWATEPRVHEGTLYVPLRLTVEAIGLTIDRAEGAVILD